MAKAACSKSNSVFVKAQLLLILPVLTASLVSINGLTTPGALCQAELPVSVDLRPQFEQFGFPARQQGNRGDCTTFADTALTEFESARYTRQPIQFSEEFMIWAGNAASGIKGDQAMFFKSLHGLQTFGICPAELMPYRHTANPVERPSRQALLAASSHKSWSVHWIKRWNVTTGLTEKQLLAIKHALATGHPVATGMRWPKDHELGANNVLKVPPPNGVEDGHTVAEVGYRDDPRLPGGGVFIFRNSFGPNWGEHGYAYIPYAYARQYFNDAVWIQPTEDVSERTAILEGENLRIVSHPGCTPEAQEMSNWGAKLWSNRKQLFCNCKRGGSLTLAVPVNSERRLAPGYRYRISLLATMAPDYGRIQAYLDGKPIGREFDCYDPMVQPTGPIPLGIFPLTAGVHKFSVSSVGKNPSSGNFSFGIDAIQFTQME